MENFKPEENFEDKEELNQEPDFPQRPDISPRIPPVTASVFGLIAVFFLYQVGGSILTYAVLGLNLKDADVNSVRLLTVAGQLLFILLPALLFARFVYTDVTSIIRFRFPGLPLLFLFLAGLLCLTPLLQSYLYIQNVLIIKLAEISPFVNEMKVFVDQIDKMVEESYSSLLASHSVLESLMIVIVVAVVPSVCEEVFFRGYIQKGFEFRYSPFKSALITAVFFGFYHMHPYQIVPLAALGLYFGYAVYLSDSIFTAVFLHFVNNLFAVIMYFVWGSDDITVPQNTSAESVRFSVLMFFVLLILFSLIIVYINRVYSKRLN